MNKEHRGVSKAELVIAPPTALVDFLTIGNIAVEREEANRLFFLYARHKKFLELLETGAESVTAQCAVNFVAILVVACQEKKLPTKAITTFDKARKFLQGATGLENVVDWIKAKPGRFIHVKETGSERSFKLLYKFSSKSDLLHLTSYDLFRRHVLDYKAWFMFAEFAHKTMKKDAVKFLFVSRDGKATNTWNKRRFFFMFLLTMHYRTHLRTFTLEEVYKMVREIQKDYGGWLEGFKENLKLLEDDTLAQMMLQHGSMRTILENLRMPEHQTTEFIASEIALRSNYMSTFGDLRSAIRGTVAILSRDQYDQVSPVKQGSIEKERSDRVAALDRRLSELHPRRLAETIAGKPWLIRWVGEETVYRLRIASLGSYEQNNRLIDETVPEDVRKRVDERLSQKFDLLTIMRDLWNLRSSVPVNFLEQLLPEASYNSSAASLELTPEFMDRAAMDLIKDAFSGGPIRLLAEVVMVLWQEASVQLPKGTFSVQEWMAMLLIYGKRLPKYVVKYLREERWYRYGSDASVRAWIAKQVTTSTRVALRENLPGKYAGDIQEVIESVTGFTIAEF